jgi:cyanuric acid amidohydrolase
MSVGVERMLMSAPDDVSGLQALIDQRKIDASQIVAVIGKTEGNGGANDFTRALATLAVARCIGRVTGESAEQVAARVMLIWSGGCEGVISPHATIFLRDGTGGGTAPSLVPSLALGVARSRPILPEEIGSLTEVDLAADAVRAAMADAGIVSPADVHYVQVKGPMLTPGRIADAGRRGARLATQDPNASKPMGRGALAMGVAVGLDEVPRAAVNEATLHRDWTLFSSVASTSVGGEVSECEVVLMGNRPGSGSAYRIGHAALENVCDAAGIAAARRSAGEGAVAAVFAKAEPAGQVFGRRTTMLSDADVHAERHARAALSGVIGAVLGETAVFISGGTEHQCAAGKAPIAIISKVTHG